MKQKIRFLLASCCCILTASLHAQFYNSFTNPFYFETASATIEMKDGVVFGFTESNPRRQYHQNILLIKTNTNGGIIWSKRYDAGSGISVKLIDMLHSFDNEILISGEISGDNDYNSTKRVILKINSAGQLIMAKKYAAGNPYNDKGLVQLKDSSFVFTNAMQDYYPGFIHINQNGDILSARQVTNKNFASILSITAKGNTADIVVAPLNYSIESANIVNINLKNLSITWQRDYKISNQFNSILSARCRNGDIIYLAGRTMGAVGNGTSRVFRTDQNGNLLWAKNIKANFDKSGSIASVFDIVSQVYVHEDINGNIVAVVEAEGTHDLMVVFDAVGNYLYNLSLNTSYNAFTETKSGNYINTCFPSYSAVNPIVSNRFLSANYSCDSSIFVTVTNGTDSAATVSALVFSPFIVQPVDIPVTVKNASINQTVFCSVIPKKNHYVQNDAIQIEISPNPATSIINVSTENDFPFSIFDMSGTLLIKSVTNHTTDISKLTQGLYSIEIITNNKVVRKMMIKQ